MKMALVDDVDDKMIHQSNEKNFNFHHPTAIMVLVDTIVRDLLTATESMPIAHQCNCVTRTSHGLSQVIHSAYPQCDIYRERPGKTPNTALVPDTPGTLQIRHQGSVTVIALLGQFCPGKTGAWISKYPHAPHITDSKDQRLQWFKECLAQLDTHEFPKVAMPWGIGCGLAGGYWPDYLQAIRSCKTPIYLYRLP